MMAQATVPFTLTYVAYVQDDIVGLFLALCSLIPVAVMQSCLTLGLFRRDIWSILLGLGLTANEVFNYLLKRVFREERPELSERDGYGMPSSHAQFAGFCCFFLLYTVYARCYWRRLWQHAAAGCILCTSALIATSRVYLHYHTVEQVLVGLGIGIASSCLYVLFLDRLGMPYIVQPLLLDSSLGVFLRLRDNKDVRDGHPFLPCRPSG